MYRARVDSVSGTKVFANGKWLTCIGNKNVKAGDFVWTDGRCVYGNFQEAQTPIVITLNHEGIPIVVKSNKGFTFKRQLEYIDEIDEYHGLFVNNKNEAYAIAGDFIACNIDVYGNVFKINYFNKISKFTTKYITKYSPGDEPNERLLTENQHFINVTKNDEVIFSIDLAPFANNLSYEIYDPTPKFRDSPYGEFDDYFNYNTNLCFSNFCFAFIENENNWAFTFTIVDTSTNYRHDRSDAEYWKDYVEVYYFNSAGIKARIFSSKIYLFKQPPYLVDDGGGGTNYVPAIAERSVDNQFDDAKNFSFPMQDGFYFKMTDFFMRTGYGGIPDYAKYTIFAPDDTSLFSGWFETFAGVSILKLDQDSYLLGVGDAKQGLKTSYYMLFDEQPNEDDLKPKFVEPGIYILENGVLEKIDSDFNTEGCLNQFLRPMKNYKNWWNEIQQL